MKKYLLLVLLSFSIFIFTIDKVQAFDYIDFSNTMSFNEFDFGNTKEPNTDEYSTTNSICYELSSFFKNTGYKYIITSTSSGGSPDTAEDKPYNACNLYILPADTSSSVDLKMEKSSNQILFRLQKSSITFPAITNLYTAQQLVSFVSTNGRLPNDSYETGIFINKGSYMINSVFMGIFYDINTGKSTWGNRDMVYDTNLDLVIKKQSSVTYDITFDNGKTFISDNDVYPSFYSTLIPSLEVDVEDYFGFEIREDRLYDKNYYPSATSYDFIDGDISHLIETSIETFAGIPEIRYKVCNSIGNCITKSLFINIIDGLTELDLSNKYAVLFYFKDFSNLNYNAVCTGSGNFESCLKFAFKYMGQYLYGITHLPYQKSLFYSNYTDFKNSDGTLNPSNELISWDVYRELLFIYNPNDTSKEHAYMFFTASNKPSKIKYDAEIFDYRIFDTKYSVVEDIDYIGRDGTNKSDKIDGLPNVDIDYIQYNEDVGSFFDGFSSSISYFGNIIGSIFSYITDIYLGLDPILQKTIVFSFSLGIFVIITKIIL